eukprot:gene32405-39187_t
MFAASPSSKARDEGNSVRKTFTKAANILTGTGQPIHKQLKSAITEGNEDKAIALYMSKEGSKIYPSKPFPTKKEGSSSDTPMHLAARHVMMKLFKMFIEYGGNPGALNSRYENCAHAVCMLTSFPSKRGEIIDTIFDWRGTKADNSVDLVFIDQLDLDKNTALHYAAYTGLLPCIQKLILRGASLDLLNVHDLSCPDMSDKGGHIEIGTMLELAWLFQTDNAHQEAVHSFTKHARNNLAGAVLVDSSSVPLTGFIDFMNQAIQAASESLKETPSRSETLLNNYGWDIKALKKDYTVQNEKVLISANLRPRAVLHEEVVKPSLIDVGISVEEVYIDPSYKTVASFTIKRDTKQIAYTFHHFDDKATVLPLDYDPNAKLDNGSKISAQSHINPRPTEACTLCGQGMLEAASVHNFLTGTIVEPQKRELPCGSGHKFCISCWSDHVQGLLKRDPNLAYMKCPADRCGEVLDIQWAPVILKRSDLVNRLVAQRQRQVIESLCLRWCPVQGCGLLVHIPDLNASNNAPAASPLNRSASFLGSPVGLYRSASFIASPVQPNSQSALCQPCQPPKAAICGNGHAFCLVCNREAHSPCKCTDVAVWHDLLREESSSNDRTRNALATMLMYNAVSKKCPVCSTSIAKDAGCNIVYCSNCQEKYCWMCMQAWSSHSNSAGNVLYCNRYMEEDSRPKHDGSIEEKSEDVAADSRKWRMQRFNRLLHYNSRFMNHGNSYKFESEVRKIAEERVYNGLVASYDGELVWLQASRVPNPLEGKAAEMEAYSQLRGMEGGQL